MSAAKPRWSWTRKREPKPEPESERAWAPASWPGDATTVEHWIRTELLGAAGAPDADGVTIAGLDGIRVSVDLDGADITRLLVDATDAGLTVQAPDRTYSLRDLDGPSPPPPEEPEILSRTLGLLHSARLTADPMRVQGHPVHVDATVERLPFDWVKYDRAREAGRPSSAIGVEESDAGARPSGTFALRMSADHVAPLIADIASPLLAAVGVRLRRLDGTVTTSRRGLVRLDGIGAVRWKIFSASVRLTASAAVSPTAVVTVKRLRLRSVNPVVAIALAMARSELRAVEGKVIDLNASLAQGGVSPRLRDLQVTAEDAVAVSGRFG